MPARIASVPFEIAHRAFDARNKLEIASQEHNVMADAERGFGYFFHYSTSALKRTKQKTPLARFAFWSARSDCTDHRSVIIVRLWATRLRQHFRVAMFARYIGTIGFCMIQSSAHCGRAVFYSLQKGRQHFFCTFFCMARFSRFDREGFNRHKGDRLIAVTPFFTWYLHGFDAASAASFLPRASNARACSS